MHRYPTTRMAASLRYQRLTRQRQDPTVAAIVALLGEPERVARRIAQASYVQNLAFEADYDWLARASPEAAAARLAHINFPRASELTEALTLRRQPLLLATLHMGHYLPALLRCVQHIPQLQELAVITRPARSAREDAACRHLPAGVRVNILRLQDRPLRSALATLRAGGVLLTMIDVPPSFGRLKTAPTALLGHPAHLPVGPATIAVSAGAIVLPLATWPEGRRDTLDCAALVDARPRRGESRHSATARVHAALAAQVSTWIRGRPGAWMLWGHVGAYYGSSADPAG